MNTQLQRKHFILPALLVALSLVPALGGIARLVRLSGDTPASSADARFIEAPLPVVLHVLAATAYGMLGAFQFAPALRRRWPRLHRRVGLFLVLAGLLVGATGLWMTTGYRIPSELQGPVLYGVRLTVASAMIACLLIASASIPQGRFARHRAFMIRAYALAQGAGTQVFVLLPWMLLSGEAGGLTRDLLMTTAWVINLVVAELAIGLSNKDH